VQDFQPDLVFLDLDMPGGFGLQLVRELDSSTRVIVVTASEAHALEAYETGATDYLVKPVNPTRLAVTLERIATFSHHSSSVSPGIAPPIAVSAMEPISNVVQPGQIEMILPDKILWIEAEQNYTQIHAREPDSRSFFRQTMTGWAETLPVAFFSRISRSIIIRPAHIKTLSWSGRDVTMVNFLGTRKQLQLGRAPALRLKALLKG
jgi:two-component system LytT family response regulator